MLKGIAKRAVIILAAMTALLIAATGQAQAANSYLILSDIDGHQLGTMTHLDVETDRFKVCDTNSDGSPVTGYLYHDNKRLFKISDGGDSGCNWKTYNVIVDEVYVLYLCWNVDDFNRICDLESFIE